jgi:hypothetical protein
LALLPYAPDHLRVTGTVSSGGKISDEEQVTIENADVELAEELTEGTASEETEEVTEDVPSDEAAEAEDDSSDEEEK